MSSLLLEHANAFKKLRSGGMATCRLLRDRMQRRFGDATKYAVRSGQATDRGTRQAACRRMEKQNRPVHEIASASGSATSFKLVAKCARRPNTPNRFLAAEFQISSAWKRLGRDDRSCG